MQMIRKKIKSRRGASITFALLLFLVCAVIGSVVLTAGTVAAGRMSQVAEMDQRYYSVNSAANLIIDLLTDDDAEIRVVKTVNGTDIKTDYYLKDASSPVSGTNSFVLDTAHKVMEKYDKDSADEGTGAGTPGSTPTSDDSDPRHKISVTADWTETTDAPTMDVTVMETVYEDGGLLFEISNDVKEGAKNNGKYTLYVRFQTDKNELRELENENGKEKVTTTLKWKLGDVQIIRKPDTSTTPSSSTAPDAPIGG